MEAQEAEAAEEKSKGKGKGKGKATKKGAVAGEAETPQPALTSGEKLQQINSLLEKLCAYVRGTCHCSRRPAIVVVAKWLVRCV